MGRKPRNFQKYGIYHVIQRGNNKAFIFHDENDKYKLVEFVNDAEESMPFKMLFYVLMNNHYHFIIEMLDDDIGSIMKKINLNYSKFYNKKYDWVGTIFGGRYTAIEVKTTNYLMTLIGYISNNPVKAGLTKKAYYYKWGTAYEIAFSKVGLTDKSSLMQKLGDDVIQARNRYKEALKVGAENDYPVNISASELEKYDIKRLRRESLRKDAEKFISDFKDRTSNQQFCKKSCAEHLSQKGYTTDEIASFFEMSQRGVRYLISNKKTGIKEW